MKALDLSIVVGLMSAMSLTACSGSQDAVGDSRKPEVAATARDDRAASPASRLVNRVWRVHAPVDRAPGSFYIFLSDGTLVMTSCVETYRLATWSAQTERRMTIVEDQVVRYDAEIQDSTEQRLRLRLHLRDHEVDLTLEPAAVPYVCPDLRR